MVANFPLLKSELHCHSCYSVDSNLALERIIATCKAKNISVIALTDHNKLTGALRLKEIAPSWLTVIPAEEIASQEGDVIGLFLKEEIPARLSIEDTIDAIRTQGGLVLLPHPFDRLRKEAVGLDVVERIKEKIDFIEIFNARCIFKADNVKAQQYAQKHSLPAFVGSDAHTTQEYGKASCLIQPFTTPAEFKINLQTAQFATKLSSPLVHVTTKLVKIQKKRKHSQPS